MAEFYGDAAGPATRRRKMVRDLRAEDTPPMPTRWLMSSSAFALGLLGLAATFLPLDIAAGAGATGNARMALLVQIAGGLYLGFALLNWSVRDMAIGGIYNRPIALGNFLHFTTAGLALLRGATQGDRLDAGIALAGLYALFAAWFGWVMFHSPARAAER
jgi:hypothetical protein